MTDAWSFKSSKSRLVLSDRSRTTRWLDKPTALRLMMDVMKDDGNPMTQEELSEAKDCRFEYILCRGRTTYTLAKV